MTPVDIHAFLEARLAEDQAIAQWAARTRSGNPGGHWKVDCDCPGPCADDCDEERIDGDNLTIYAEGGHDNWQAQHIARHDPARVLREVAAKRRVLERHHPATSPDYVYRERIPIHMCEGCGYETRYGHTEPVTGDINDCPELRDIAAIYADHEDYAPKWSATP